MQGELHMMLSFSWVYLHIPPKPKRVVFLSVCRLYSIAQSKLMNRFYKYEIVLELSGHIFHK